LVAAIAMGDVSQEILGPLSVTPLETITAVNAGTVAGGPAPLPGDVAVRRPLAGPERHVLQAFDRFADLSPATNVPPEVQANWTESPVGSARKTPRRSPARLQFRSACLAGHPRAGAQRAVHLLRSLEIRA
jgi:hypothetical protein